jgi:hypothetical protein
LRKMMKLQNDATATELADVLPDLAMMKMDIG